MTWEDYVSLTAILTDQANKTNTRAYNLANQTRGERKGKERKDTTWEDSLLVVETGCRDLRVSIPSPGKTLPRRLLHGSRRISSSISWKQILRPNRHLVEYLGWLPTTLRLDVLVGDRVQRGLDVRGQRLLSSTYQNSLNSTGNDPSGERGSAACTSDDP